MYVRAKKERNEKEAATEICSHPVRDDTREDLGQTKKECVVGFERGGEMWIGRGIVKAGVEEEGERMKRMAKAGGDK